MKYWTTFTVLIVTLCILAGCSNDSDDDAPIIGEEIITWSAVSAGGEHTLALRSDGTLWAWGQNAEGQLGVGNNATRLAPVQVGSNISWIYASAGGAHSVAITSDSTLMAWGWNNPFGQLGCGTQADSLFPILVGGMKEWALASAGGRHNLFIKTDGSLWACGDDTYGQLGNGGDNSETGNCNVIVMIGPDVDWITADAGYSHSAALKLDGTLRTWGANGRGQLGDGTNVDKDVPIQIGSDWSRISAGGFHTVAIKSDGTLWAWGANDCGQLGDGTNDDRWSPVQIGHDTDWTAISAGKYHTLAMKSDRSLWAWGKNADGQLGDGTGGSGTPDNDKNAPVPIGTDKDWNIISAGGEFSVALKTGGSLWAWGDNSGGQHGNGTRDSSNVPVFISE